MLNLVARKIQSAASAEAAFHVTVHEAGRTPGMKPGQAMPDPTGPANEDKTQKGGTC